MSDSVSADPRIGSEIAGYRIEALVGRGGMGAVYRAHDIALDCKVALKLISPDLAGGGAVPAAVPPRVAGGGVIDHANIVPIHNARESRGSCTSRCGSSTAPTSVGSSRR